MSRLCRSYKGRVVSATATHVRMELDAQYKTVTVKRQDLGLEGQSTDGSRTPASGPPPTPSHPGVPSDPPTIRAAADPRSPHRPNTHANSALPTIPTPRLAGYTVRCEPSAVQLLSQSRPPRPTG